MPYPGVNKNEEGWMERCVDGVSGSNKRTGKPYTKSEKIAICKSQLNKKRSKAAEDDTSVDDDIMEEMDDAMMNCIHKKIQAGDAATPLEAMSLCEAELAKSEFDLMRFKFIISRKL